VVVFQTRHEAKFEVVEGSKEVGGGRAGVEPLDPVFSLRPSDVTDFDLQESLFNPQFTEYWITMPTVPPY
jgi:hypothetical protein